MKVEIVGGKVAVVTSDGLLLPDTSAATDLIANVAYMGGGAERMVLYKQNIAPEFFRLSSGFAGEVAQKFVTYRMKLAIVGDLSEYTSKPLHDYVRECNRGRDIFFVDTLEDAVERLLAV